MKSDWGESGGGVYFIATCQSIGLDYARKKYAGEPVGEYWISLAGKVIADQSKRSVEPERTPTIQ